MEKNSTVLECQHTNVLRSSAVLPDCVIWQRHGIAFMYFHAIHAYQPADRQISVLTWRSDRTPLSVESRLSIMMYQGSTYASGIPIGVGLGVEIPNRLWRWLRLSRYSGVERSRIYSGCQVTDANSRVLWIGISGTKRNALHPNGRLIAPRSPASRFGPVLEGSLLVDRLSKKHRSNEPPHRHHRHHRRKQSTVRSDSSDLEEHTSFRL